MTMPNNPLAEEILGWGREDEIVPQQLQTEPRALPWEKPNYNPQPSGHGDDLVKRAVHREFVKGMLGEDVFDLSQQKPVATSTRDLITMGIERALSETPGDPFEKLATSVPSDDSALRKRKQEFVEATREKRALKIWSILNSAIDKCAGMGRVLDSERGDAALERLHDTMNTFIENALLAA
jgi:hypothetical protein